MDELSLWEILVPTVRPNNPDKFFRKRYHKIWDARVREISGGLTILKPVYGEWISPDHQLIAERMIPVRICCTEKQIDMIAEFTAAYYEQQAVLYYRISDSVHIKRRE